ncbi:MGMT family protein [Patescibacteria group bacterium]|nr:MGMT family protein [Patescibacteria group bacterium]
MVKPNFRQKVLAVVASIPKGSVSTYGRVARLAGSPKAARAVGNILHNNSDPDRIPCHRVVSSTGKLSCKYAFGGIEVQTRKLQTEGVKVISGRVAV